MQVIRARRAIAGGFMAWALAVCGGSGGAGGGGDAGTATPPNPPTEVTAGISLLAGGLGGRGAVDGATRDARLCFPGAMAQGADGTVYFVDCGAIRAWSPNGVVSTVAGSRVSEIGERDGPAASARFNAVMGLAVDASGTIYGADPDSKTLRRIAADGTVSTVAGSPGDSRAVDGKAAEARFLEPYSLVFDTAGNLLIGDRHAIRQLSPQGIVSTIAGLPGEMGATDGPAPDARFNGAPRALTTDAAGALYISDWFSIRKLSGGVVSTVGHGPLPSDSPNSSNGDLGGLAFDAAGSLLVSQGGFSIIDRVAADGSIGWLSGGLGIWDWADGPADQARFAYPRALLTLRNGDTLVADSDNAVLRRVAVDGSASTVLGSPPRRGHADGTGAAARLRLPRGVVSDRDGNLFVADYGNHCIRKITPAGVVTTFAGKPNDSRTINGQGSDASFAMPVSLAIDAAGNLYVADEQDAVIRKVTPAGAVSTLAGAPGQRGSVDGPGGTARFYVPRSVAVDAAGFVYVADAGSHAIRRISPAGATTTLAGLADHPGRDDGTGDAARFYFPVALAVDGPGNVFVAEQGNHTVRRITPAGVVTTVAGKAGEAGWVDGAAAASRLFRPNALAFDADGNLFISDEANSVLRRLAPDGVVSTVAGRVASRAVVTGADGRLNEPQGLAVLPGLPRRLVVTDENAILVVTPR